MIKNHPDLKLVAIAMMLVTFLFSNRSVLAAEQLKDLAGEIDRDVFGDSFAAELKESVNFLTIFIVPPLL